MTGLDHSYIDEYGEEVERMVEALDRFQIEIRPNMFEPVHNGIFEDSEKFVEEAGYMGLASTESKLVSYMERLYGEMVVARIGIKGPIGESHTDIGLDYKVSCEEDGYVRRYWELNPGIANTSNELTVTELKGIEAIVRDVAEVESFEPVDNPSEFLSSLADQ